MTMKNTLNVQFQNLHGRDHTENYVPVYQFRIKNKIYQILMTKNHIEHAVLTYQEYLISFLSLRNFFICQILRVLFSPLARS